jgi:hypothetical protein
MCYYFKSKYDNLELAQNEQAKILYDILQKERRNCMMNMTCCPLEIKPTIVPILKDEEDSDSSDESDDETNSTTSDVEDLDKLIVVDEMNEDDVKHLSIQEVPPESQEEISFIVTKVEDKSEDKVDDYGKMTMKQLKELLSNKGIKAKPNMRKEELIELIHKKDLPVSGSPNFGAFSSENIEIEGMEEISA